MSNKSHLTKFVENEKSATELKVVFEAYKYHIMYGARVADTQWTKRQRDLFKELINEDDQ